MKQKLLLMLIPLLLLPTPVRAAELPEEVLSAVDERTRALAEEGELQDASDFTAGALELLRSLRPELSEQLRSAAKSAVLLLLVVLLAGLASSVFAAAGKEEGLDPVTLAGVLAMTAVALTDLGGLLASAQEVLTELDAFARVLLPTLAAAAASCGAVATASVQQVVTVWLSSLFIRVISTLLLPLLYCYLALAAAAAALPEGRLSLLADGMRKAVSWLLGAVVSCFTVYLSIAHVLSGSADALTLRLTKAALSGVVPVVGNIISDTAETVLAGAGLLKNAVGIVGLLGVLSLCLLPFLSLLLQCLVYRVAAVAAATADSGPLSRFLTQLSGAFSLLLGMVGSCALLVFISIIASVAVVTP
ncbi:MAG: stage III sporulation protein AE [Oscillospiraceae bacterium]